MHFFIWCFLYMLGYLVNDYACRRCTSPKYSAWKYEFSQLLGMIVMLGNLLLSSWRSLWWTNQSHQIVNTYISWTNLYSSKLFLYSDHLRKSLSFVAWLCCEGHIASQLTLHLGRTFEHGSMLLLMLGRDDISNKNCSKGNSSSKVKIKKLMGFPTQDTSN